MACVELVCLLVSCNSLLESVSINRLCNLDDSELSVGIEIEVLVSIYLFCIRSTLNFDSLCRNRFL